MRNIPSEIAEGVLNWLTHAPNANTVATKAAAATENVRHVLQKVWCSYDADPTGGSLTVAGTVGGSAVSLVLSLPAKGAYEFEIPLVCDENKALTVTLASAGEGVTGKIAFCYR